jgi:hypothetical protein
MEGSTQEQSQTQSAPQTQSSSPPSAAKTQPSFAADAVKKSKSLYLLFFGKKFQAHRLVGLFFLIEFVAACWYYGTDYKYFLTTPLVWSVGFTGWAQSITAAFTFTFMPNIEDPGFIAMSDKAPLSYRFILENSFFSMLLAFQYFYMTDGWYETIQWAWPIEIVFVFLPYYFRPLWPTTRLRTALANNKNKSDKNRAFMVASTYVVKVFYSFAKHYIGFFLNYIRFLGRVTPEDQHTIYGILITSSYMTTIAIFIHTLKFKGWIGPKTAAITYESAYLVTAYFYLKFAQTILANLDLALLCFIGLALNFGPKPVWHGYQALMLLVISTMRATSTGLHDLPSSLIAEGAPLNLNISDVMAGFSSK